MSGGGGTKKYSDLEEKPLINGVELDGNKTSSDLGVATSQQGAKADTAYQKPLSGIPESDLSSDVQQALQKHFKGWYDSSSNLPANPVVGDYAYVEDNGTTYIYRCTTNGEWPSTSTEEKEPADVTFAGGEEVNETYIDDTHLVNPVAYSLPKAEDAMLLKQQLKGITLKEQKVSYTQNQGRVYGSNGSIQDTSSTIYGYTEIAVNGVKAVRFLGILLRSGLSGIDLNVGYAFGHYDNAVWVTDTCYKWKRNTENTTLPIEYNSSVPSNSTHFRCTCKLGSFLGESNFYLYTCVGDTVVESIKACKDSLIGDIVTSFESKSTEGNSRYRFFAQTSNLSSDAVRYGENTDLNTIKIVVEKYRGLKIRFWGHATEYGYYSIFKREPSFGGTKTLQELIDGDYLSSHMTTNGTTYNLKSFISNGLTEIEIPEDAEVIYVVKKLANYTTDRTPQRIELEAATHLKGEIDEAIDENQFKGKRTFSLVGKGSDVEVRNEIRIKLQEGCVYRVYKPVGFVSSVSTNYGVFGYIRMNNNVSAELSCVKVDDVDTIPDYFDIVAKENDYYIIFGRADYGTEYSVTIEQIDISSNDIVCSFNKKTTGGIIASTGLWNESTTNVMQSFKDMIPTLGKRYVELTWMIFLYSARNMDLGLAWYDSSGNFIKGIKLGDINVSGNDSGDTGGQRESVNIKLPIPSNAAYFNCTYWGSESISNYPQLQKAWRVVLTDREEDVIPYVGGNFAQFIDFLDYDGPTGDTLMLQTYSTLIAQWDAVQAAHSEVMPAKRLLGYGTASSLGTATQDTNLPIYEYVVNPIPHNDTGYEEYDTTIPKNLVKVLIATGVHGAEKPASTSVLELVKNLVGHYQSSKYNDALVSLAQNCEYHIIPCVNPYGYDIPYNSGGSESPRNNARGVNINRNFGHNWTYQAGGDVAAKGDSPYSELETQIVRDWIAENKDAFIYIDAHTTYLSASPLQGCYNYPLDLKSKSILNSYIKGVSVYAQREWPSIFTNNQYIGFLGFWNMATTSSEARYVNNIPRVATLEVNTNSGGLGRGNEEQMILSLNQIVNYIRLCILTAKKENYYL